MKPNLLIIDDSLVDLRLIMDMMVMRQIGLSVATDGKKGYYQALMLKPSLILLDVRMPGMDGFATCRMLKANPTTQLIPVIFLTAANDLDERLEGFSLGAVDFIGKPFYEAEVLARIGVHLNLMPKRTVQPTVNEVQVPPDTKFDEVLFKAAQTTLREQIGHPPSLEALAQLLGSNRRQINEAFQACCGQPVFGWLREERLRQAHHLICRTDTPISLIGEHLGYSSPANFARAFRERFGFAPGELRRSTLTAHQKSTEESALEKVG